MALAVPSLAADEAACQVMFESVDVNKDGSVDATEGAAHFDAINASDANLDIDGDGNLTALEFAEACKAVFPTWLDGPPEVGDCSTVPNRFLVMPRISLAPCRAAYQRSRCSTKKP